jgi:hypothetical protein
VIAAQQIPDDIETLLAAFKNVPAVLVPLHKAYFARKRELEILLIC